MADGARAIRPAPPGLDAATALADLHARAFDRPWRAEDIEAVRTEPGALLLQAGEPARGFVLLRTVLDEAEILALAVDPAARRAGLGRALVETALTQAARAGVAAVWLEVAQDNAAARALYAALDFEETGRRRAYYPRPDGAVDALAMCKRLNSG